VYQSLLGVIQDCEERLHESRHVFSGSEDADLARQALDESFRDTDRQIELVVDLFTSCDRVDSARIPFEMIRCLRVATQQLTNAECGVVLHLSPEFNYEIRSVRQEFEQNDWLDFWLGDIRTDSEVVPRTVLIIVFPSYEVSSVPLHAVAAHELAHLLADQWASECRKISRRLLTEAKHEYQTQRQAWMADRLIKVPGLRMRDVENRLEQLLKRHEGIAHVWVLELLTDLIAVRLVGPAFFAALERITLGLGGGSDGHPPDDLRRQVIREYVADRMPEIYRDQTTWQRVLDHRDGSDTDNLFRRMARDVCRKAIPELHKLAERVPSIFSSAAAAATNEPTVPITTQSSPTPARELADLLALIRADLMELIPPSELLRSKTASDIATYFWLLFYSTWHFRLDKPNYDRFLERYQWSAEPMRGEAALGSLLLHSIQSLELSHRWETALALHEERQDAP